MDNFTNIFIQLLFRFYIYCSSGKLLCHNYLIEFFMLFASALLFIVCSLRKLLYHNYIDYYYWKCSILLFLLSRLVFIWSFYSLVFCYSKCSIYCSYYLVMSSFLFYEIMDWGRLVLCFIILLFRFRSYEVYLIFHFYAFSLCLCLSIVSYSFIINEALRISFIK